MCKTKPDLMRHDDIPSVISARDIPPVISPEQVQATRSWEDGLSWSDDDVEVTHTTPNVKLVDLTVYEDVLENDEVKDKEEDGELADAARIVQGIKMGLLFQTMHQSP